MFIIIKLDVLFHVILTCHYMHCSDARVGFFPTRGSRLWNYLARPSSPCTVLFPPSPLVSGK